MPGALGTGSFSFHPSIHPRDTGAISHSDLVPSVMGQQHQWLLDRTGVPQPSGFRSTDLVLLAALGPQGPGISRFNVLFHLVKARNRHVCLPLWLKEGFLGLCYVADEWAPVKDCFEFSAEAETVHPGGVWSGASEGRPWLPMSWEHFSLGWWPGVHPFTVPGKAPAPLHWARPSSGLRPFPGRPGMILP